MSQSSYTQRIEWQEGKPDVIPAENTNPCLRQRILKAQGASILVAGKGYRRKELAEKKGIKIEDEDPKEAFSDFISRCLPIWGRGHSKAACFLGCTRKDCQDEIRRLDGLKYLYEETPDIRHMVKRIPCLHLRSKIAVEHPEIVYEEIGRERYLLAKKRGVDPKQIPLGRATARVDRKIFNLLMHSIESCYCQILCPNMGPCSVRKQLGDYAEYTG